MQPNANRPTDIADRADHRPTDVADRADRRPPWRGAQLSRPARRALLAGHIAASVSWLGLSLCLLVLGITGAATDSPGTGAAAYRAMKIFGDWLIVPVSLLTLTSGVVLSLGTPWGLARYRWVWTKFWLTLATTGASIFALRSGIDHAAAEVDRLRAGEAVPLFADLVAAPAVSTSAYLFMTVISVLKPWGRTARGRRPGPRTTATTT
ncbi:DUF2269 domain-containing protein [Streptomyces pactum]|uniref:DUF2269 domain-containing protein n=1 Tax=Streptomyces pactum TaxID=68249 RepID=UPI001E621923|nr:DUF2269 domain-containing protein [Streptomyces pactum]